MSQTYFKPTTLILLTPLVLCAWGFSWPIMKLALPAVPPLWLAVLRLGVGTLTLFIILWASGRKFLPNRQDLPLLFSVGVLQMGCFTMLIMLGLMHVEAGRSAILTYTTPLWVTPIAVLFFKEHLSKLALLGIIVGILGVLCMFNPLSFNWHDSLALKGNGLLLLAAFIWAMVIIHVRFGIHHRSPLELAPWQMLLGTLFVWMMALIFEPKPAIDWSWHLAWQIAYLGPIASAFAYWGVIELNRQLPAITISLLLLAVPVIGLLSSAAILGEAIKINTLISMILILVGIACVAVSRFLEYRKLSSDR
ncbi:MAG TPA: DMT family transporter [Gammaproteobacteria bacterium]|nr:DMT family transporter [Gammaproteobacteria bacterium]